MQWHKRTIIVQKLTLVVELWALLSPHVCHRSSARSTVIGSVALRKGLRSFCPHCSDRCRVLMLTCRNSPLWKRCEDCNKVVFVFILAAMARSIQQHGHHMKCALIGTSHKLAVYNYTSSLALWTTLEYELVDANGGIQEARVEPATRSAVATCCRSKKKFSLIIVKIILF